MTAKSAATTNDSRVGQCDFSHAEFCNRSNRERLAVIRDPFSKSQSLDIHVFELDRGALIQKVHRNDEPL
jgi:hypothetical protein